MHQSVHYFNSEESTYSAFHLSPHSLTYLHSFNLKRAQAVLRRTQIYIQESDQHCRLTFMRSLQNLTLQSSPAQKVSINCTLM